MKPTRSLFQPARVLAAWHRQIKRLARQTRALRPALAPGLRGGAASAIAHSAGQWLPGVALGLAGARRYRLYRPPMGTLGSLGERLPLLVMLHGCGQDASALAASTRMNRVALREGFMVLYPEQDRLANPQGCWNWFDTSTGRAGVEADSILQAIDQVCLLHAADRARVAIAGLSAGASMAALVATRHPARFKALVMHSGIAPGTAHSTLSALGAMQGHRHTAPLAATPSTMASHWPPLLVLHGAADALVAPSNGQAAALLWADAAGARAGAARRLQRGQRYAMHVTDFKRQGRTMVQLVAIEQLGHAWSGGLASQPFGDGRGPDASRLTWAFCARQFRP